MHKVLVSGNPKIRSNSKKGYDAEITALKILKKLGFEIIYAPEKIRRERNSRDYKKEKEVLSFIGKKTGNSIMPEINRQEWITFFEEQRDSEDPSAPYYIEGENQKMIDKLKNGKSLFDLSFVDVFCKKGKDYYIFDVKNKTYRKNTNLNRFYVTNYEVLNYNKIQKNQNVELKIMIILEKGKKIFYNIFNWSDFLIPSSFNPHTSKKTSMKLNNLDINSFELY